MTTVQKRKLIEKIVCIESDLAELERVRIDIGKNGYASATLSSSGGSRSYTRLDLDKIYKLILDLNKQLSQYTSLLYEGTGTPLKTIVPLYS